MCVILYHCNVNSGPMRVFVTKHRFTGYKMVGSQFKALSDCYIDCKSRN